MTPNAARTRLLLPLLLLPGAAASLLLPNLLHSLRSPAGLLAWRIALAMPVIACPPLLTLARVQPWQTRAAIGLGAGPLDRLRWIWLPQFGPSLVQSLLLAALLMFGAWLVR